MGSSVNSPDYVSLLRNLTTSLFLLDSYVLPENYTSIGENAKEEVWASLYGSRPSSSSLGRVAIPKRCFRY